MEAAASVATVSLTFVWIQLAAAFRYEAPQDCEWNYLAPGSGDVALTCRLRTINSEFESTNFSVIPSRHTARLRIECSEVLFFKSSLQNESFERLSELRELEIAYCKIGEIPETVFRGMRHLRNLTVRTLNTDWPAMTLSLHSDSLESLVGLENLDLGENNIWTLPPGLLCPLRSLRSLNLTRNRLQEVGDLGFQGDASVPPTLQQRGKDASAAALPLPPGPSRCSLGLLALDLSHNDLVVLPAYALSGLGELQVLSLQDNEISMVADHALLGLSSLRVLNLSSNRLVALPPEIFQHGGQSLQEIYLRNNSLGVLAPGLFAGLGQLLVLDVSHNELTSSWVTGDTFSDLARLAIMNLSHNRLTRLDPSIFHGLYNLQVLDLERNGIQVLPPSAFASLYNLQTLVLSGNRLTAIDALSLEGLYVVGQLALDANRLTSIHPQAFRNASGSLQDLNLRGNQLDGVPEAVRVLKMLRTLDLSENRIASLEDAPFREMVQLYGLRLIDNRIANVSRDTFSGMSSLKILNLARNRIRSLEPGSFDGDIRLHAVRLDSNQLSRVDGLFADLPSLIWLNVSDNRLERFDFSLVPRGLQWLDMHRNRVRELGDRLRLDADLRLQTLDASFNLISEVDGRSVPDSLELLFLNDNLISKVEAYAFFPNENLTRVDLYANRLTTLEPNSLRLSPRRRPDAPTPEFYIAGNPFRCDCTVEWLQKVNMAGSGGSAAAGPGGDQQHQEHHHHPRIADLEGVSCRPVVGGERGSPIALSRADPSRFLCAYRVHCFALCHCCDFDACDCEMTCPTNCTCFHDQSWAANIVDCTGVGYRGLPDRVPMDATEAYLDGNSIGVLMSHAFIGRKNLRVLFLNASRVRLIHNRTFNGLRALRALHLEDNDLTELRGFEFDPLAGLRELFLHNNRLTRLGNASFAALTSLRVLTLSGNRLARIDPIALPTAAHLSLAGNPWTCECAFVDGFRSWLQDNRARVRDAEAVRCVRNVTAADGGFDLGEDSGSDPSSSSIPSRSSANLTCGQAGGSGSGAQLEAVTVLQPVVLRDYLPLLLATLGAFVVVLVAACLFFAYRQEVRAWAHARCGLRFGPSGALGDEDDRPYDAFVAYSSKDETFVVQYLAPYLEHGHPSYRLCLQHRDLPPFGGGGGGGSGALPEAVRASKRTLVVLSKNFVQTEWCCADLRAAVHQAVRDRSKRLVVVVVGEVAQRDLDPDMRICLKTNPCLLWGERLFWEKLRYALPDARARPPEDALLAKATADCRRLHSTVSSLNSPYWTIRSEPPTSVPDPHPYPQMPPPPLPPWNNALRNSLRYAGPVQNSIPRRPVPEMMAAPCQDYIV